MSEFGATGTLSFFASVKRHGGTKLRLHAKNVSSVVTVALGCARKVKGGLVICNQRQIAMKQALERTNIRVYSDAASPNHRTLTAAPVC